MTSRAEEDHAKIVLERELGVVFQNHDDGSRPGMPDLLSLDGIHVAEVITTTRPAVREAQQRLDPMPDAALPHCVLVMVPYTVVGGATKSVRHKIKADVLRWTAKPQCRYHWSSPDEQLPRPGVHPDPILGLGAYDDGVNVMCVHCQHSDAESHQIEWSIVHEPSSGDPLELIRQSLYTVDKEQRGGVQALSKKLNGYPNKHLVMYPFGPPGNLTAEFSRYAPPLNSCDLLPPRLNPPLTDIHVWLLYRYGKNPDVVEGFHVCSGHWTKFGTTFLEPGAPSSPLWRLHYRDA